ncbi:hypothetical protein Tco_0775640 [Tanacetum coccineum]
MRIPAWMITDEMNLTEHYKMYAEVFGLDVPLTQSQPTESTQGTHRTTSAPRQSTRLTPPVPVPTLEKADEMILQDMFQVRLAEQKSHEEQQARENVALIYEHLAAEEIEKLVEELEPKSDKECPEVEIVQEKEEETTKDTEVEPNIVIPINVDDEEDEITDEVFELRRRAKGKNVEESRISPIPSPTRSPRNLSTLVSSDTEKLQELTVTHPTPSSGSFAPKDDMVTYLHISRKEGLILERKTTKEETERLISKAILQEHGQMQAQILSQIQNAINNAILSLVDASVRSYMLGHILHQAQVQLSSVPKQQHQLYLAMKANPLLQQQDIAIWLALQMKFEKTQVPHTACRPSAVRTRDQDDPHDDAQPERENKEPGPSTLGNQEQDDEFDFWTDSYASDDDEIPTKQVSQDIMEEISLTIDEAESMKKITPLVQSCQRDPEAPALSLINQDLLYLKKGNLSPENIILSLNKFPAIVFNDDDIEERTSRWVNKCIKKFNPYARYGVENWKNPHGKIFYIRR